ncbi:MAG: hypothetical protein ABII89_01015 [Candidatus Omnitrophota bacterium]
MCIDNRQIIQGREIPAESYCDQPYIVPTDDDAWLCCITTGKGSEGDKGQHVITLRSADKGCKWSEPVPLETMDSPENSYAVMLKIPFPSKQGRRQPSVNGPYGRIYIFYNHNTDNIRKVERHDGKGAFDRVDCLGYFVFKYSDDHGRNWSVKRYVVPVREFACDRENIYRGKLRFFWNVGKPFIHAGSAYVPLHKVGRMGEGFFAQSEGALLKSDNLLTENEPEKIRWETLPDGEQGLRTPPGGGPVSEEQSFCVLSDGSFYCVYRSIDGYPVESYSRDGGHTWTEPRYKRYADGRLMKHPRAANFVWKCSNGKYLYWFHNHGGRFIREMWNSSSEDNTVVSDNCNPYDDRNPVWLCGGEEIDTPGGREILWSQPEIVLYDDDPYVRMSYPDMVEEDGEFFLTETQKNKARVHKIDPALLDVLWNQFTAKGIVRDGLLLELPDGKYIPPAIKAPLLPLFCEMDSSSADYGTRHTRRGFTIEMCLKLDDIYPGQVLIDGRCPDGKGLTLVTTLQGTVKISLNDGRTENRWDCDPGILKSGRKHRLAVTVDAGPCIITFTIDGVLNDGGEHRQFGWGRFSPNLRHCNGSSSWNLSQAISSLRVYGRALRVGEIIANFRSI